MREYPIIVTDQDIARLRGLLSSHASIHDHLHLTHLESELDRAAVLASYEMPVGVVTIGSLVRVLDLDTGGRGVMTIVLPNDSDIAERRISVLAPIGTLLLGARAGDDVEWETPFGSRRLHIEHVMQPSQIFAAQRVRALPSAQFNSMGVN